MWLTADPAGCQHGYPSGACPECLGWHRVASEKPGVWRFERTLDPEQYCEFWGLSAAEMLTALRNANLIGAA